MSLLLSGKVSLETTTDSGGIPDTKTKINKKRHSVWKKKKYCTLDAGTQQKFSASKCKTQPQKEMQTKKKI